MATQFADFTRVTRKRFSELVSDGYLENTPLWHMVTKAKGPARRYSGTIGADAGIYNWGGNGFQWTLATSSVQSGTYGPSTVINPKVPDTLLSADLAMGGYWVGYALTDFETMSLGTEEEFVPLLKVYEQLSEREWYTKFEAGILTDVAGEWDGLPAFMADTGTYATNVDLSQTYAKPFVFNYSGSGQNFAVNGMDKISEAANKATHGDSIEGSSRPDFGILSRTDWQSIKSLIEDTRHIMDVDTDMISLGFIHFMYDGVRFHWSDKMEVDAIRKCYILNSHYLGVAHAGGKLFVAKTGVVLEGMPRVVNLALHKGNFFCTGTRNHAVLNNIHQQ